MSPEKSPAADSLCYQDTYILAKQIHKYIYKYAITNTQIHKYQKKLPISTPFVYQDTASSVTSRSCLSQFVAGESLILVTGIFRLFGITKQPGIAHIVTVLAFLSSNV